MPCQLLILGKLLHNAGYKYIDYPFYNKATLFRVGIDKLCKYIG